MKRNKSKATRKRDRKRHEQYIEQKKVTENNKETEIKETNKWKVNTLDKMLLNYSFCKYDLQKVNIIPYCH
jgi:hypothetical protein